MFIEFIIFIEPYERRIDAWCSQNRDCFDNIYDAKDQCNADTSCTMVLEVSDPYLPVGEFSLCNEGAKITKSEIGAILHIKRSV